SSAAYQYKDGGEQPPSNPFQNKFIHPEFAGNAGYTRLKRILRKILPLALFRTWEAIIEYQKDHNSAYVGVPSIAAATGRSERKIYMDLQELVRRGYLKITPVKQIIKGELHYHTIKD